ncbi:MAG TPA: ABC transporter permease [Anaerolineales bacterium]|nr:ABC transporter permease [Anaerolineales bacterium]
MINSRLTSLIRKEFIQILRDPRTLILVLVIPIMQLLLLGYAATNDVRNVPLAVFDQDRGPAARALLDAYRTADYFRLEYDVDSEEELRTLIDDGLARAGLIIPPNYSQQLESDGVAQVAFVLDGSDPTVASTSLSAAQLIGQSLATKVMAERLARGGQATALKLPIEVRTQVWYNPDLVSAFFMIPGVIGMILYALTSILTATAIVRERERGTIEQLIVTPIRPWELVVGKILPYVILAFMNTLEVLAIGSWWFKVPIRGELSVIFLLSGVFLLSSLGIGLLASTIANTQQEAMLTVWMTLLPGIFLSGFFFPLEAMPKVLQWISYLMPLRYYLVIIRSLLLKGVGYAAIQDEVIALTVFGFAIMAIAALRFRKRLD